MRALWSALDAAATPASTLAILAALVRTLSASDYGILVIALAASGLSMAVNPAIAATTTKFVSELSGRRHPGGRTVAGVITVSLLAVAAIDLVLFLGTAVFNKPLSQWVFGAAVARPGYVGRVLLLAVLAIGLQQIETVLAAGLRGLERFRRQALIEILSRAGAGRHSNLRCLAHPIAGSDFDRTMRGLPGIAAGARRRASPAAAGWTTVRTVRQGGGRHTVQVRWLDVADGAGWGRIHERRSDHHWPESGARRSRPIQHLCADHPAHPLHPQQRVCILATSL